MKQRSLYSTQNIVFKGLVFFLLISLFTYGLHNSPKKVHAINMQSNEYRIQFGTVDSGGNKMTDPVDNSYNLSTSVGQSAANEFQSNGYVVKAGFQYIYSRIPFTFSLSTIHIDFGSLLPSTPATGNLTMSVSFGGAGQYIVTALADAPLTLLSGSSTIPFTSCDGGINTCTITAAKTWTSSSAYGFGYNMTGQDVPTDFTDATYYRPFANKLIPDVPQTVMQSNNVTEDITPTPNPAYTPAPVLTGIPRDTIHQATMTMKTNISALQPAGTYVTVIRFLATPSF